MRYSPKLLPRRILPFLSHFQIIVIDIHHHPPPIYFVTLRVLEKQSILKERFTIVSEMFFQTSDTNSASFDIHVCGMQSDGQQSFLHPNPQNL